MKKCSKNSCPNEAGWVITDAAKDDYLSCYDHLVILLVGLTPPTGKIQVGRVQK
jgi:hypothetical protein